MAKGINIHVKTPGARESKEQLDRVGQATDRLGGKTEKAGAKAARACARHSVSAMAVA